MVGALLKSALSVFLIPFILFFSSFFLRVSFPFLIEWGNCPTLEYGKWQNDSFHPIFTVFITLSFTLIPFCHFFWQYINCALQQSKKNRWRKKTLTLTRLQNAYIKRRKKLEPLNRKLHIEKDRMGKKILG